MDALMTKEQGVDLLDSSGEGRATKKRRPDSNDAPFVYSYVDMHSQIRRGFSGSRWLTTVEQREEGDRW